MTLKNKSLASSQIWKAAGKPRPGPIFDRYRRDKSAYKNGIRLHRQGENRIYTNEVHEALLAKQGTAFWECWRSKFESNKRCINQVDSINDSNVIAEHFASHFDRVCLTARTLGHLD